MKDMEEWIRDYGIKTGMTYEEIVKKALEFYKESIDSNMSISDYKAGKELRSFLNKIKDIYSGTSSRVAANIKGENVSQNKINNNSNSSNSDSKTKVLPKEGPKISCEVIEKSDEKESYLKGIQNLNPDLMNIILSEKTYVLKMLQNKATYATAIISFEKDEKDFQQYAFIHYVDFSDNKYKKLYSNIEKEIVEIAKKNNVNNIDRIVNGEYIEQFRSIGYKEMYKNYSIKLNIENSRLRGINEYAKNSRNHVSSKCVPIFKMCPKRFKENEDPNSLYKFSTSYGKFYAKITIKNEKCYAKLYLDENKINRIAYLKNVYYTFVNDLYKNGIKIVYTLVGEKHINILKSNCDVAIIKEWTWIRKSL